MKFNPFHCRIILIRLLRNVLSIIIDTKLSQIQFEREHVFPRHYCLSITEKKNDLHVLRYNSISRSDLPRLEGP